jgi:hypothetical protein
MAGAVACVRQLSAAFYKLELPYTADQIGGVLDGFVATDASLSIHSDMDADYRGFFLDKVGCSRGTLLKRARNVLHRLLAGVNPLDIKPQHGSGASACKLKPWERWTSAPRYVKSLDDTFCYADYFFAGACHLCDEYHEMQNWPEEHELKARVVLVPKDSRGPRLISCEPREYMYIQQGLMSLMYDRVDHYKAISGQVGFTDQTRNQVLAQLGSFSGRYVTLDLKEASDRVSLALVEYLFPENWVKAFKACRSPITVLPDGREVRMVKFAPMGSALCFPVEALTFWSLCLAAMDVPDSFLKKLFYVSPKGTDIPEQQLTEAQQMCLSVFGDDIIVEQPHPEAVVQALECVGLAVNRDKSYDKGPFRESCGHDYFHGSYVSPTRFKHGLEGDDDNTCFRTVDALQGIIDRYGLYSPSVVTKCATLFREFFGFDIPVASSETTFLPLKVSFASKLVLTDPYHGCSMVGQTLLDKRERRDKRNPKKRIRLTLSERVRPVKYRIHADFKVRQMRVLTEVAHNIQLPYHDWCHVNKALLTGGEFSRAGVFALAKRNRYKYGWTSV